jgi:hypothetical protein
MMLSGLTMAGNVLVVVLAIVFWVFAGTYTALARWERSEAGRALFVFSTACASILTLGIARMFIADSVVFAVARLVLYGGVLYVAITMLIVMVRAQRAARRERARHRR